MKGLWLLAKKGAIGPGALRKEPTSPNLARSSEMEGGTASANMLIEAMRERVWFHRSHFFFLFLSLGGTTHNGARYPEDVQILHFRLSQGTWVLLFFLTKCVKIAKF
jgi:hypothetical protein